MMKLCFDDKQVTISANADTTILDLAISNKVDIPHSCGGNASCGTCRVEVLSGLENCSERNELELEMATDRDFPPEERLACQTTIVGDVRLKILGNQ